MKRLNASVMAVAVVLVLIAFVAPSSAYSICCGDLEYDPGADQTTWEFYVDGSGDKHAISHFVAAWCNSDAVVDVTINTNYPYEWMYDTCGHYEESCGESYASYTIKGIKVEFGETDPPSSPPKAFWVTIILNGHFESNGGVEYLIKADGICTTGEDLYGPSACTPIPEFSTIAIPIASILGLLFFFNHRKRREEE